MASEKQTNTSAWVLLFTDQKISRPRNYIITMADELLYHWGSLPQPQQVQVGVREMVLALMLASGVLIH